MNENYERRLFLLSLSQWDFRNIMEYFKCSQSKAYSLKKDAVKLGLGNPYSSRYVKPDSVLALFETSVDEEISKLKKITA